MRLIFCRGSHDRRQIGTGFLANVFCETAVVVAGLVALVKELDGSVGVPLLLLHQILDELDDGEASTRLARLRAIVLLPFRLPPVIQHLYGEVRWDAMYVFLPNLTDGLHNRVRVRRNPVVVDKDPVRVAAKPFVAET